MAEAEAKTRTVPMIAPNRVQTGDHARTVWVINAESGENPGDFLQPEYWANVAQNMRPMDHVEVRSDDGTYWGEFLVTSADRNWAKLHLLREIKLQSVGEQPVDERYKVEWKGAHLRWCVIRSSDKSAVHEGAQERGVALRWLEEYLRTIGRKAA
jgi:hypothetical protein